MIDLNTTHGPILITVKCNPDNVGVSNGSQEEADKAADAKYGLVGGDDTLSTCGIRVGGGWSGMAVE